MVDSQGAQNLMVESQRDKSANTPVLSAQNLMVESQDAKKFNGRFAGCSKFNGRFAGSLNNNRCHR